MYYGSLEQRSVRHTVTVEVMGSNPIRVVFSRFGLMVTSPPSQGGDMSSILIIGIKQFKKLVIHKLLSIISTLLSVEMSREGAENKPS